jgi:hypothetical protein
MTWGAAVTREQAIDMVTETLLGGSLEGVRLYVRPAPLAEGEVVSGWRSAVFTAPAAGWLIFVDPAPLANWEHPCQFVFVDGATGDLVVHAATTPPSPPGQLEEITSGRDNPLAGESEKFHAWLDRRLREVPHPPSSGRGNEYALIISGGYALPYNHVRFWNDCSIVYKALANYYE